MAYGLRLSVTTPSGITSSNGYVLYFNENVLPSHVLEYNGLSACSDDGGDIRFYATSALATPLPIEIVSIHKDVNPNLSYINLFVRISSQLSYIYMTYNDSLSMAQVGDSDGRNAVWSDYYAVWHMNSLTDSTGNGFDLTPVGSFGLTSGFNWDVYRYETGNYHTFNAINMNLVSGAYCFYWLNADNTSQSKTFVKLKYDNYTVSEHYMEVNRYRVRYTNTLGATETIGLGVPTTYFVSGCYNYIKMSSLSSIYYSNTFYINAGDILSDGGSDRPTFPYSIFPNNGSIGDGTYGGFSISQCRIRKRDDLRFYQNFRTYEYENFLNPQTFITSYQSFQLPPQLSFYVSNIHSPSPAYIRLVDVSDISSLTSTTDYLRIWKITNNRTSGSIFLSATSRYSDIPIEGLYGDTFDVSLSAVY